jgi:hypothetical protein
MLLKEYYSEIQQFFVTKVMLFRYSEDFATKEVSKSVKL